MGWKSRLVLEGVSDISPGANVSAVTTHGLVVRVRAERLPGPGS